MRRSNVYFRDQLAGTLTDEGDRFVFVYDAAYLKNGLPLSCTLPLQTEPYESKTLHPFFDGLIIEGWLLQTAVDNWKVDPNDRMALLLLVGKDTIGAVSILEENGDE